jgi:proteasome beta subunit
MEHNMQPPAELKTGTTTVGLIAKDSVVLASDQRATMGYLIASKTAKKIYKITDQIGATIAGSVADAQSIMDLLRAEAKLFEIQRGRPMVLVHQLHWVSWKLVTKRIYRKRKESSLR